ncbi:sensor histidine kinase [Catenuloplanes atrovinosus]|uniref:histidine kinase n=1 Tax=Catenuloplanes atrovinosus TaxID=137266 RepID=A0AAE3YR35_9ACTN|nr:histidine kinase [Catenuloplanes atrovinosus]MDR7276888.1 signal transduction histidine kinase [Catenuloplanes atrovinosus]
MRLLTRWRGWDVTIRDLPAALLLFFLALPALGNTGTQLGTLPTRPLDAWGLAVLALECLPLAIRRKWPVTATALAATGFALDQLLSYHTVGGTAFAFALISAGAHVAYRRRLVMVLLTAAFVALAAGMHLLGAAEPLIDWLMLYAVMAALWAAGGWLRASRAAEAERRRQVAEATREAERTRIARELHDVVTHHVTAMVVQAEAARYLTAAPDRLDATLTAVTDTGRRAITDLRHLLDLLNPEHGAIPAVGAFDTLVERTRDAGQPVELEEQGTPAGVAGSAEFVAYRVVQESLTNALKYAHGSPTVVRVRHGERTISVEISTAGTGTGSGTSPGGSGRGLAGLRERVAVLGGEFSAGPDGGGFLVRAVIPLGGAA